MRRSFLPRDLPPQKKWDSYLSRGKSWDQTAPSPVDSCLQTRYDTLLKRLQDHEFNWGKKILDFVSKQKLPGAWKKKTSHWGLSSLLAGVLPLGFTSCHLVRKEGESKKFGVDKGPSSLCESGKGGQLPVDCLERIASQLNSADLVRWFVAWGKTHPVAMETLSRAARNTLPRWRQDQLQDSHYFEDCQETLNTRLVTAYLRYLSLLHTKDKAWKPLTSFRIHSNSIRPLLLGDRFIVYSDPEVRLVVRALDSGRITFSSASQNSPVRELISLSSMRFVSLATDGTIKVWQIDRDGALSQMGQTRHGENIVGFESSLRLIPIDQKMFVSGYRDKFQIWNSDELQAPHRELPAPGILTHDGQGPASPLTLGGSLILVAGYASPDQGRKRLKIWNIKTGKVHKEFDLADKPLSVRKISEELLIVRDHKKTYGINPQTMETAMDFDARSGLIDRVGPSFESFEMAYPIGDEIRIIDSRNGAVKVILPRIPHNTDRVYRLKPNFYVIQDISGTITFNDPERPTASGKIPGTLGSVIATEFLETGEFTQRNLHTNEIKVFSPWITP